MVSAFHSKNYIKGTLGGGYIGGSKRRPRSEWQIQRGTHEALITAEEAEAVVSRLEKRTTTRMRGDEYQLTGLLQSPAGKRWHGDTRLLQVWCPHRLTADGIIKQATKLAREGAAPGANEAHVKALRRQSDELNRKICRVRNVMTVIAKPEAMAPKLVELVDQKQVIDQRLASLADHVAENRVVREVSEQDVRSILNNLVAHISDWGARN